MVIAVLIVLLLWALWFFGPQIRRWLMRRSINYMQDKMYQSMGIDPDAVKQARKQAEREEATRNTRHQQRGRGYRNGHSGKVIPADYGEYVDFEVLTMTGKEVWLQNTQASPVFNAYVKESQITDVKYVII